MPMGEIGAQSRLDQYLPLSLVRARLTERWTLEEIDYRTGGPARYVRVKETGGRLGFITPLTHNFCESCNRVRLTCTGTLFMCLGQDDAADLRAPLRRSESDELLDAAIAEAIARKPRATTSSSTAATPPRRRTPHERHRRVRSVGAAFLPCPRRRARQRQDVRCGVGASSAGSSASVALVGEDGAGVALAGGSLPEPPSLSE